MKVKLPFMIQDMSTSVHKSLENPVSAIRFDDSEQGDYQPEVFLDGPICSRVAVLDFDEDSGKLHPPVPLNREGAEWNYVAPRWPDDRRFQALSPFSTVLKVLAIFESPGVLGRRISWAFDGPQLLVVPRAGTWPNAFYERATRSLQFFSFPNSEGRTVHTCLSHDIVSHEAGHAVLDAIAPYLYDCVTPQSLALHEAVGDLTTLFSSLEIGPLAEALLEQTNGDLRNLNAFSAVAEEFGLYTGSGGALRKLWNTHTVANAEDPDDFHHLSQVLSGAVYQLLVRTYEENWGDPAGRSLAESGEALAKASLVVRRFALRGLDYLPPGEITFADFGRAVIAADTVSNPDNAQLRKWFAESLAPRVDVDAAALGFVDPDQGLIGPVDPDELMASDFVAYRLVEQNRAAFHVPADVPFNVDPRLAVRKTTYRGAGPVEYAETILKISWQVREAGAFPRWVRFGSTVAFDASGSVRSVVTSNPERTAQDMSQARDRFVERLVEDDLVDLRGGNGEVSSRLYDGAWLLSGSGRCLHVAQSDEAPVPLLGRS